VSHILIHYLRVNHSLTPSPWGVREFLERLWFSFLSFFWRFPSIVFLFSKSGFQVNGSVLTQLNELKLDERVI
jgi:hypothetical protein